ncbi:hypothetical protein NDU88_007747 [Pleurodeles waltl]|uniref:Uncharacterized protein n=1 Tax=Pleurodeles waltl TaxID=8319 RepID=A0AAV7QNX2_PLEWA|nr:hypothetical protein NDU88_007747 [Pleurodeles waltl]
MGANEHRPPYGQLRRASGVSVASIEAEGDAAIAADAVLTHLGLTATDSLEEAGGADLARGGTRCSRTRPAMSAVLGGTSSVGLNCVPGLGVLARH